MPKLITNLFLLTALTGCLAMPSEQSESGTSDLPSSNHPPIPGDIPVPVEKVAVEKKGRLVNHRYIRGVLEEVFNSTAYPLTTYNSVPYPSISSVITTRDLITRFNPVNLLDPYIIIPSAFGGPCDIYSASGDTDCGGNISGSTTVKPFVESGPLRQMTTLNVCEIIIGKTNSIKAAAEKINEIPAGVINDISLSIDYAASNIPKIHSLFFRHRLMSTAEFDLYRSFDADLRTRGLSKDNRWRAMLLMLCESPDWQIL